MDKKTIALTEEDISCLNRALAEYIDILDEELEEIDCPLFCDYIKQLLNIKFELNK